MIFINACFAQKSEHLLPLFSSSKLFKKFTDDDDREKTHAPFARGI